MTIEKVERYLCTNCGRLYEKPLIQCGCQSRKTKGQVVGPFQLLEKINSNWKVECIFCGNIKEIHYSNLKRQKSCGCVPRHINIKSIINNESVHFYCSRCGSERCVDLPQYDWCCNEVYDS